MRLLRTWASQKSQLQCADWGFDNVASLSQALLLFVASRAVVVQDSWAWDARDVHSQVNIVSSPKPEKSWQADQVCKQLWFGGKLVAIPTALKLAASLPSPSEL